MGTPPDASLHQMEDLILHNSDLHTSEQKLIDGLLLGDAQVLVVLYDQYSAVLYGMITPLVAEEKLAEEILQKVMLSLPEAIKAFDASNDRFLLWMCRLARDITIEMLNGDDIHASIDLVSSNSVAGTAEGMPRAIDLVWRCGYSYSKAAGILGIEVSELRIQVRKELLEFSAGIK